MSDPAPSANNVSTKYVTCKRCNTRQKLTQTGKSTDPQGKKLNYGSDYTLSLACGHDAAAFA